VLSVYRRSLNRLYAIDGETKERKKSSSPGEVIRDANCYGTL